MVTSESWTLVEITLAAFEVLGVLSAIKAILTARSSQGAIAWVLALVTIPVLSVPLYCIFGRTKFRGYVNARRLRDASMLGLYKVAIEQIEPYRVPNTVATLATIDSRAHREYRDGVGAYYSHLAPR